MKLSLPVALFSALLYGVQANFDVYETEFGAGIGGNYEGFLVLNADANCDEILNTPVWPKKDDVYRSHGFRAEYGDEGELTVLEMNFKNVWHYTWYDYRRGGGLYGLHGEIIGTCYRFPLERQSCSHPVGQTYATRVMRCESRLTPDQLNSVGPR